MGDTESRPSRLSFNPQLRVEFRGATVTSDAGLVLPREVAMHCGREGDARDSSLPRRQHPKRRVFSKSLGVVCVLVTGLGVKSQEIVQPRGLCEVGFRQKTFNAEEASRMDIHKMPGPRRTVEPGSPSGSAVVESQAAVARPSG